MDTSRWIVAYGINNFIASIISPVYFFPRTGAKNMANKHDLEDCRHK